MDSDLDMDIELEREVEELGRDEDRMAMDQSDYADGQPLSALHASIKEKGISQRFLDEV